MNILTWYPHDLGRYSRDTRHLTMLEHGAFRLLLDCYYATGGLPEAMPKQCSSNALPMLDHSRIYRVCCAMSKHEQDAVDAVLKMFFTLNNDGFYTNSKADKVILEQTTKHENRVKAGKMSNSKAMLEQCSSNTPQKENKKKNKNPPTPLKGGSGVLTSSLGDGGVTPIDRAVLNQALDKMDARQLEAFRKAAPGWDKFHLRGLWLEWLDNPERGMPNAPVSSFIAWCLKYTKGKRP